MAEMKGLATGAACSTAGQCHDSSQPDATAIITSSGVQGGAPTQPPNSEPMQGTRH